MKYIYCIYELICPKTNLIRYVGMSRSVHRRYRAHRNGDENSTKNFFYTLKKEELLPILKIIMWDLSKSDAIKKEGEIISFYKDIGQCDLNTYIGHTPLTKKIRKPLTPHQERMKKTRKLQCQAGIEKERLILYNETRKIKIVDQNGTNYESIRDCSIKTGCHRVSIGGVLRGDQKQTKGYTFRSYNV